MTHPFNKKIFIGFCFLLIILYNRILRERPDKSLYLDFNYMRGILYASVFICMVSLFVKNIIAFWKWWQDTEHLQSKFKILLVMRQLLSPFVKVSQYILNSLCDFDAYIKNNSKAYDDKQNYAHVITERLGLFLQKNTKITLIGLFLIIVLCQIIPVVCLCIDVFIFEKISYFYKILWILIFPMIITYIIYSIRTDYEANLALVSTILDIKIIESTGQKQEINYHEVKYISLEDFYFLRYRNAIDNYYCMHSLKPEIIQQTKNINVDSTLECCTTELHKFLDMRTYVDTYDEYTKKYLYVFNILKYFLYSICWLNIFSLFITGEYFKEIVLIMLR